MLQERTHKPGGRSVVTVVEDSDRTEGEKRNDISFMSWRKQQYDLTEHCRVRNHENATHTGYDEERVSE